MSSPSQHDFSDNASSATIRNGAGAMIATGLAIIAGNICAEQISAFGEMASDVCAFLYSGTHLATKLGLAAIAAGTVTYVGCDTGRTHGTRNSASQNQPV